MKLLTKIAFLTLFSLVGFLYYKQTTPPPLGATFNTVAGKNYYLYGGGVGSSDTSVILTSFQTPVSNYNFAMVDFGNTGYLTIEPGSATRQEFISFTGVTQNSDGTATLTGVTRGLSVISPYTASTTLQKAHAGGSIAILSNPPQLYEELATRTNDETITGIWTHASTAPPRYASVPTAHSQGTFASSTAEFASFALVNNVAISGAANSSESVKGLVELATAGESASSTILGSTGAGVVLQARYATDTPSAVCTGQACVVVASLFGKIKQAFLDLAADFTWTGGHIFANSTTTNATSTSMAISSGRTSINGVSYKWPSTRASTTVAQMGADGDITWGYDGRPLKSVILQPYGATTTLAAPLSISGNTIGFTYLFPLHAAITVSKISIFPRTCATAGSFKIGIYTENGQTSLLSTTTKSVVAGELDTSTLTTATVLEAGNYYIVIVPNGTADCALHEWDMDGSAFTQGVSGEPVLYGRQTVTASTLPTTFTPSSLNGTAGDKPVTVRLDD